MNISFRQEAKLGILLAGLVFVSVARGTASEPPLVTAATAGDIIKVKALLADGAKVNAKDQYGRTPLFSAALKGYKDIVELLLVYGADANVKDKRGVTPLWLAAFGQHKEVIEILLANKADVNTKENDNGTTPLHTAALKGNKEVVEILLDNGADANAADKDGRTPLAVARLHNKEIANVLLARSRSNWPTEVSLTEETPFALVFDGKQVGTTKFPAGTKLKLIDVQGAQIKIILQDREYLIPKKATDFVERAMRNCLEQEAEQSRSPASRAAAQFQLLAQDMRDIVQKAEEKLDREQQPNAKTVEVLPSGILAQIKAKAQAQWPDDYEMQAHTIKKQTEAYHILQGMTSLNGIPSSVLDRIKSKAASEWPNDYDMQVLTIKNQVKAYQTIQ